MEGNTKKIFIANDKNNIGRNIDLSQYTHIRAYHACRPVDVGIYYKEGIRAFEKERMRAVASDLFNISIDEVIKNERSLCTFDGKVYFNLFEEELVEESGHYLTWGSEYLAGLAVQLDKSTYGKYHNILSQTGIPTIFACDIPLDLLDQNQTEDLSASYVSNYGDLSCYVLHLLSPEYIVGHSHPSKIFDPIHWKHYTNDQITCSYCDKRRNL